MKLVTFSVNCGDKVGALYGDKVIDIKEARILQLLSLNLATEEANQKAYSEIPTNMVSFIEGGEALLSIAKECVEYVLHNDVGKAVYPLKKVKLRAPIPNPPMILNMGNAYRPIPMAGFSPKYINGLIGPDDSIVIPKEISEFGAVWEVEIGIVVGKSARRVPNDETAYDYVYGYTVYNDVTDYGKQIKNIHGNKNYDTFCPMGPCIATKDEVEDPHNLIKRAWVNGQLAIERSTKEMLHKIPEFLSIPSKVMTLPPGTIISTGACGSGRIKPGDIVEFEITKIGKLRNPVIAEK